MSSPMSRRTALRLTVAAAVAPALGPRADAGLSRPPVLVELFTSQGCSSSPPADAFMAELARRNGIVALTYNIDYWDYLGWTDTLGSRAYSERQRKYAVRRGDGQIYTPQMVINGRHHVVGSRRQEVFDIIAREAALSDSATVPVTMAVRDDDLVVDIAGAPTDRIRQDSTVWIAAVAPRVEVAIAKGENSGRSVTYVNVVRRLIPAGTWHGEATSLVLPRPDIFNADTELGVAIVQVASNGPVLGCTAIVPGPA